MFGFIINSGISPRPDMLASKNCDGGKSDQWFVASSDPGRLYFTYSYVMHLKRWSQRK